MVSRFKNTLLPLCTFLLLCAPAARAETVVSLSFDDGTTDHPAAAAILESHGVRGTFYINSGKVGTPRYLSWSGIHALAEAGHEIGGHTLNHVDLGASDISDEERQRQICDDRARLVAEGFNPESFAYPYGHFYTAADSSGAPTEETIIPEIVRNCGYSNARRVGGVSSPGWCPSCQGRQSEVFPPPKPFATRTAAFGSGEVGLEAMKTAITTAEGAGGDRWLQLVFHGVCDTGPCGDGWVKPSTLTDLLDWLAPRALTDGTVVKTVGHALDRTPPETRIERAPQSATNESSASFDFSSEPGATYQCSLGTADWAPCPDPQTVSGLSDGTYTLRVRAIDAAGNVDASPLDYSWTVDTTAPDTSIGEGPAETTQSGDAAFRFGSEPEASHECRIDDASWETCTSPVSHAGVGPGPHKFEVRATDIAGNVEQGPASWSWTVVAPAPEPLPLPDPDPEPQPAPDPQPLRVTAGALKRAAATLRSLAPATLARRDRLVLPVVAPGAGRLRLTLTGSKGQVLAKGRAHAGLPGPLDISLGLAKAGRRLLREAKRVPVILEVEFKPADAPASRAARRLTLSAQARPEVSAA